MRRNGADTLSFPVRSFWRNLLLFPPGHDSPPPPLPPQLSTGRLPCGSAVLTSKRRGLGGEWGASRNSGYPNAVDLYLPKTEKWVKNQGPVNLNLQK